MPKVRHVPLRQCVACRQMRPKREMVRIVRTPSGEVRVDPGGKVSGRGAYVCPTATCVEPAIGERRLQHALEVPISDSVAAELRAVAARGAQLSGKGAGR